MSQFGPQKPPLRQGFLGRYCSLHLVLQEHDCRVRKVTREGTAENKGQGTELNSATPGKLWRMCQNMLSRLGDELGYQIPTPINDWPRAAGDGGWGVVDSLVPVACCVHGRRPLLRLEQVLRQRNTWSAAGSWASLPGPAKAGD